MAGIRRLCVFCGSGLGNRPAYREHTVRLGELLAERGIGLVYGGSGIGLMGELAKTVLSRGGSVTGVIPAAIHEKVPHLEITELQIVGTMHERKARMYEISDGFIAMPGGIGTLDELFEIYTWSQLGIHHKPVGLYDVEGYFSHMIRFLDHAVHEGFLRESHRESLVVNSDPLGLLRGLESFLPPREEKWVHDRPENQAT